MKSSRLHICIFLLFFSLLSSGIIAQPTWTLDPFGKEKKPEQYEEKMLGSERTASKKFTTTRRIIQNNVTHYNYYYNANNKLNTVIERARIAHKDDFSKLLPFYSYSLDNTASQKTELDSIIYKSTAGILLHDLRNDWIDNMYLLIGKAYFFRKEFDSAALTFQFINYNLFPRKKNEDDNRVVGTNQAGSGGKISIADKEKRNKVQKILTLPPSRNDALIWLARTFTDMDAYGDAAGMINILQGDPNLPKRLKNDLDEVNAYWFYKQGMFDSSAFYLDRGISNALDKQDRARWEFLLAQMYEMKGDFDMASEYYGKAAKHTVDPVMDIYARLNDAKLYKKNGNIKELEKAIGNLLKMAKKDKYESYRDIIYYSAGQLGMELPDTSNSIVYYTKSIKYNESNAEVKNKALRELGNISYSQALYKNALGYYDSLDLANPVLSDDSAHIDERRRNLVKVVEQLSIIQMEDSLQMIAAMAPAERDAFIKKLSRKLRKVKPGKDKDEESAGAGALITFNDKNPPPDMFETSSSKGEWYFYNASMKSKGFNEFKNKWGKRDNIDNWRRKSASDAAFSKNQNISGDPLGGDADASKKDDGDGSKLVNNSYDGLLADVPLTEEKMDSSNNRIARALLELAKIFQYNLEDYAQAIHTYDIYLQRFPDRLANGDVYLGLYYCYFKLGDQVKANYYKNLINTQFEGSSSAKIINNPLMMKDDKKSPEATAKYAAIYDKFLEGKFEDAINEKVTADSLYGDHYWSPQLLYIESVYLISNRNDSQAIDKLMQLIQLYPTSPLKDKASTMIDVLRRRAEIEAYLTKLEVTRMEDEKIIFPDEKPVESIKPVIKAEEPKRIEPPARAPVQKPETAIPELPSMVSGGFKWQPEKPQMIMMVLDKTDGMYVNEARNAFMRYNRQKYYNKTIAINKETLTTDKALLLFSSFADAEEAFKYVEAIKKAAPVEVSWLPKTKYSFYIISESNLVELKKNPDLEAYRQLLNNQYPGKF